MVNVLRIQEVFMRKTLLLFVLMLTLLFCNSIPGYAVENGYVNVDALNVRTQGIVNENSYVLGTLGYGESVAIIGEEDGWYKIVYNEMAAFVKKEYITLEAAWYENTQDVHTPSYQVTEDLSQISLDTDKLLNIAASHLGTPYRYGGCTPGGFDCSGFTQYCYKQFGINLNRSANEQLSNGVAIDKSELVPGDLVFFGSGSYANHVGIYVGNDTMIHSPRTGRSIEYTSISTGWYANRYIAARRVF